MIFRKNMKITFVLISFLFPILAYASLTLEVSLEILVHHSDHLLVGHMIGVDMIDDKGEQVTHLKAMTEPYGKNLIRLIIQVDDVLISNVEKVPDILKVPLDPFLHYSLGQIKKAETHHGEAPKFLLLLKGRDFQPPFAGVFKRHLSEQKKIMGLSF